MENSEKSMNCLHFGVINRVGPRVHLTENDNNYQRSESTRCKLFLEFKSCGKGLVV